MSLPLHIGVATPWMRFKCWLLHGRHHSIGTDTTDTAIYAVRWCSKCGVTIPRTVVYKTPAVRHGDDHD